MAHSKIKLPGGSLIVTQWPGFVNIRFLDASGAFLAGAALPLDKALELDDALVRHIQAAAVAGNDPYAREGEML